MAARPEQRTGLLCALASLSWPQRLLVWFVWGAFIAPVLLWTQRSRAPGAPRLVAATPLLAANLAAPLLFTGREVLSCFTVAVATAMLTNLKIVAWITGRGALALHPLNLPQWMAVYSLPITPSQTAVPPPATPAESSSATGENGGEAEAEGEDSQAKLKLRPKGRIHETVTVRTMVARFAFKAAGLAGVTYVLNRYSLAPLPNLIVQTFSVVMILSIASDMFGAVASAATGLTLAPHFDNGYAATSAADFWNKRWNQVVSNLLRQVTYDPIMEGRLVHAPGQFARFSQARRVLGVLASFVMSGLLHEMLYWYPTRRFTPHLLWFWHFTVWGLICIAENVGKKVARKRGIEVPRPVAMALFQTMLHAMLYAMWFPPLNARGIPVPGETIMTLGAVNIADTWTDIGRSALGRWVAKQAVA